EDGLPYRLLDSHVDRLDGNHHSQFAPQHRIEEVSDEADDIQQNAPHADVDQCAVKQREDFSPILAFAALVRCDRAHCLLPARFELSSPQNVFTYSISAFFSASLRSLPPKYRRCRAAPAPAKCT